MKIYFSYYALKMVDISKESDFRKLVNILVSCAIESNMGLYHLVKFIGKDKEGENYEKNLGAVVEEFDLIGAKGWGLGVS